MPEYNPDGTKNENRKFKGRVVFQGNTVKDQNWDVAMFQDLSASPATMPASRVNDAWGAQKGHCTKQADATQAYIQAFLKGPKTWIRLPFEMGPVDEEGNKLWKFYDPVVPLVRALYGHPSAGAYWELHAEKHLVAQGFEPIREWKSCFIHRELKVFLMVYVDDFKCSGRETDVDKAFELIKTDSPGKSTIPLQLDDIEPTGRYLGCQHVVGNQKATWHGDGVSPTTEPKINRNCTVNTVTHDMRAFFDDAVDTYCQLAGIKKTDLPAQYVPFGPETGKDFGVGSTDTAAIDPNHYNVDKMETNEQNIASLEFRTALASLQEALHLDERRYKSPATKKNSDKVNPGGLEVKHITAVSRLGYCGDNATPSPSVLRVQAANTDRIPLTKPSKVKGKAKAKSKGPKRPMTRKESEKVNVEITDKKTGEILTEEKTGVLQPIASRILMKILYGARMARLDLLRAVAGLARNVTKWTEQCDVDLHALVAYIKTTNEIVLTSWIGDTWEDIIALLYCDSDLAGDIRTHKSTSGVYTCLWGPCSRFTVADVSKAQTAVSISSTEAEAIAASLGMRAEGIPLQNLWSRIVEMYGGKEVKLEF